MIPGFGGNFFIISMLFDKVMMIISRFGGLILTLLISFILSSYLYFIIEFNFKSLVSYKLISMPEPVIKYFIQYLKNYYHNRAKLPLSETFKILIILVAPYATIKLFKIIFGFLLFALAMKLQNKIPTISSYILRKVNVNSYLASQISIQKNQKKVPINQKEIQNNHIVNNGNESINQMRNNKTKINLRK